MTQPDWQWNEQVQRGTDYNSVAEVAVYDRRMSALRDVQAEADSILDLLQLSPDDTLVEIGTGTGAFSRAAAKRCRKVVAVDVSPVMLAYARKRAEDQGIGNVIFQEAGFLTYDHEGEAPAAIVTQLALHHLADAWKLVALQRLARLLRRDGRLYLTDVVFPDHALDDWPSYVQGLLGRVPANQRHEMARHVAQEFSTFDSLLRVMLERAGFSIERAELEKDFLGHYLCRTHSAAGQPRHARR
jgi:ubiquinone/menaquinone biosynthesis C-methylase UbiE